MTSPKIFRSSTREWVVSILAVVVVLGIAVVSHTNKMDCYALDIGKPGDPWTVMVSDSTKDGLCHG